MPCVVFTGCSFTAGFGLNKDDHNNSKKSKHLWVNLCHQNIPKLSSIELVNSAVSGSSNTDIFEQAIDAISKYKHLKYLICCWTSMPRYSFHVGFELYETKVLLVAQQRTHNLNKTTINKKYLQNLLNRLKVLHHLQYEIVRLIKYINVLIRLCTEKQIEFINVNSLCPWDKDFFVKQPSANIKPSGFTAFTQKEILSVDSRDDEEIFKLYDLQHTMYDDAGGVHANRWINLYNPLYQNIIDVNYDNLHPGIKSNELFYQIFARRIENIIN